MACLVQNSSSVELSHGPKRIKKNWDTTSSSNSWSPLYGGGTSLDQEAIQYIHKFYCKDCRMEAEKAEKEKAAAAVTGGEGKGETELPTSPQSTLEEMSLQQSMDKNKESLKRKLMMRRSVTELVDQGIYPPLSTPPAFAEQRRHLERAKTGDLLKHKIQHRPDRQVLVQQHILEDTKIDPSLHERQRKLKRARIADDLNDKLSHRPGPLELLQGNILHTDDENFKTALQAGSIPFNRTFDEDSESNYGFEDESTTTSDGVPSPCDSMMSDICSPPIIPPAPEVPSSLKFHQLGSLPSTFTSGVTLTNMTGVTGANTPTSFSKLSPITTQSFSVTNTGPMNANGLTTLNGGGKLGSGSSSSVNKNRPKKPKPKAQPKTKVIKFHEYKGPPNVVKTQAVPPSSDPSLETPYHIMLQQQQLFLQWQLEFQSKNPSTGPGRTVVVSTQQTGLDPPATIQVQTSSPGVVPVLTSSAVVSSTSTVNTQTSMQGQPLLASPPIQTVVQQAVKPSQTPILHTQPQVQVHTQPQVQIHTQPQVQVHTQLQGQPMVQAQSQISLQAQPGIQAQSSGPSTVQMKSPVVAKPFPVVSQLQSSTPAQSPPTPSKPLVQTKTIIQGQPSVQLQSIIPGKQQQQKTTPQRVRPVLQNTKNSLSNITKPLMNLEDMKVADLKAELKKRNLTVSGAKPQLIERLKPYLDVSVSHASTMNNVRDMKKLPVHAVVNVHSMPTSSSSPAILSPSNEVSMSSSSPPISPTIKDKIFNPLSPEVMDIAPPTSVLTAQMKNSLHSASTGSIPMADDSSRPSSVNPDIAMDVDSSLDFSNFIKFSPASSSATSVPPTITQTTATSIHSSQPAIVTSPPVILDHTAQTSPHPSMQEEILQQQRLKIAQLQKQLEESQKILQQQMQQQHLQHHLQHNNPQQTASPPQATQQQPASPQQIHQVVQQPTSQAHSLQLIQKPTSPQIQLIKQPTSPPQLQQLSPIQHQPLSPPQLPQQVQIIHAPTGQQHTLNAIKVDADGKAAQQPNTKMVQITAPQTISLVDGSGLPLTIPVVSQGMQSILVPNLMDKTTKQNLENFVVSHGLNRSLNIATKPSTITSSPSVQQPYSGRTITLSPINGISSSKPTSLPSSPVEGKNQIMRTTSNPIFVPMRKEPPNYDDAVKNLANKGQNLSLVDNKCASKTSIKSQAMDDVLEILIRNGELPPSAAQEPPPTPKTQTSTITTVTSDSVVSSSQFQFSIFGGSTSTTTTINTTSTSGTTDVYSLLNGPITATPSVAIKKECHTPPPFVLNEPTDSKDLGLDINEMLNQDLTSMDWADDAQFSLDLTDTSTMQIDQDKMGTSNNILSVPTDENYKNNLHGSEPDLAALGINDTENVNMDVSDWLDVIMPSTGLTPLSANAPVQFPSDPILTPKTQQEVLDLFSFEDGEFGTPTDIHTGINWEKLTS